MDAAVQTAGFGQEHFGAADLGHRKRTACLVRIANQLQRHPGGTLPEKLTSPKDYKALMRLVNRPEVTHATVIQSHYDRTRQRIAASASTTALLIHDTTELDYSSLASLRGHLGQIGNGNGQGYLCHNTLAVEPGRRAVYGLMQQILHCRDRVSPTESVAAKRVRENRESRLWTRAVEKIGPATGGRRFVDVCDRGADVFEFLAYEVKYGRPFVVRSTHNRSIQVVGAKGQEDAFLHDYARTLPALDHRPLEVQGRNGAKDRTAQVSVAATPVRVIPPHVKRGDYDKVPLDLCVVRVWEAAPPKDAEPIEWFLLVHPSLLPAPITKADAWQSVDWYQCRWVVEEFHKAKKTGCRIEALQFTTVQALQPVIALLSVLAVTLLNLRDASRQPDAQTRLATEVVDAEYVEVLSKWRHQEIRMNMTVHDFFKALARLGGHLNRKCDRLPGWITLWRGWMNLQLLQAGYEIRGQR